MRKHYLGLLILLIPFLWSNAQIPTCSGVPYTYISQVDLLAPQVVDYNINDEAVPVNIQIDNRTWGKMETALVNIVVVESRIWITKRIKDLDLFPGESKLVSINLPDLPSIEGQYNLRIYVETESEKKTISPTRDIVLRAHSASLSRIPLFEIFTSSTCGPCVSGNAKLKPVLDDIDNYGAYTCIKYQMDWPGSGDPYYTAEGGTRRANYGVTGIPYGFLDGATSLALSSGSVTTSTIESAFATRQGTATSMQIDGSYSISGSTLTVDVDLASYFDYGSGLRLYVAVVEKRTTGNKATNGETEFFYVFMKFASSKFGESLGGVINGYTNSFNFTTDLSSTNIEEMDDVYVVAFVQHQSTEEVFNSAWILPTTSEVTEIKEDLDNKVNIYPNPTNGMANISLDLPESGRTQVRVLNMLGQTIEINDLGMLEAGDHNHEVDLTGLAKGVYTVQIHYEDQVINKQLSIQ